MPTQRRNSLRISNAQFATIIHGEIAAQPRSASLPMEKKRKTGISNS
jgi:hypothetical protein